MTRRTVLVALTPFLAVGLAGACGPSVSAIYEANIRFEHCYRLDLDPNVAPGHRITCWREWSRRYTYGQTRDRFEYARRRIHALQSGDSSRPELDLTVRSASAESDEAPQPTNVHAPPPKMLPTAKPREDAGPPDGAVADAGNAGQAEPPGAECSGSCRPIWRACREICNPDSGSKHNACKACDSDYSRCVQRCFK
ncbi:MAG: hypothetical protein IPI67_00285 [Myxococcales bacterium]|nr:hypothetical protein [Myxococcales bacterium]